MNRLQKKCFIASTGVHLLLVLILFVGPAFLSRPKKAEDLQELNFIPKDLVDALVSGGGTPRPAPPARTPPAPAPERVKEPDPPSKEVVKETKQTKPEPESLELPKKPKLAPENLKIVSRNNKATKTAKKTPIPDMRAQELAKASEMIRQTARGIKESAASAVDIRDEAGPSGGGPTYANYKSWIYTVYLNAWVAPEDATSDSGVVEATITIARDGTVISSKLTSKSGDPEMDASVQRTLSRVATIGRSFPEGVKENERTYVLRFDIKMKRGVA